MDKGPVETLNRCVSYLKGERPGRSNLVGYWSHHMLGKGICLSEGQFKANQEETAKAGRLNLRD